MSKQGYLIARNRQIGAFFTTASAYDRPRWVALDEATKYMSVDMAQAALKKLLGYGAFEARLVPIQEVISLELPDDAPADPAGDLPPTDALPPEGDLSPEDQMPGDDPMDDQGMVADNSGDVCPGCQHEPCTCEQHDDDLGDDVSDETDIDAEVDELLNRGEFEGRDIAKRKALDDELSDQVQFRESATMPAKPALNGRADNKNTVDSAKKPEKVKFKDDLRNADAAPGKSEPNVGDDSEKVNVPASVLSALQKVSSEMTAEANKYKERDDARSSFCMTVAAAMDTLKMHLSTGTVDGVKQAQIQLGTMMSPITQHIPDDVKKYIHTGGRKPSLKDMFSVKWEAKRG
jgi:hypothetical protein